MRFPHFVLVFLLGFAPWILPVHGAVQQDIKSDISRADNFYYQGEFKDALTLLNQLEERLKGSENVEDRSRVKLLMGLAEVALGEPDKAHDRFLEFCVLNPSYVLDELQYPRRVVTLFKEAQQECVKCEQICARSESFTAAGKLQEAADLKADADSCGCSSRIASRDDSALRKGRDLFAQARYPEALREFQFVLKAVPESAARREAVQSAQTKVNGMVDTGVAEWRRQFVARDFELAAATYDRIRTLADDATGASRDAVRQIAAQYQSTFQSLTAQWDAACLRNDKVAQLQYRQWGMDLDPKRTIQPEALDRLRECTKPAAPKGSAGK